MKRKAEEDKHAGVNEENEQETEQPSSLGDNDEQVAFTPIEFSANDLMDEMKKKKKRRKKKANSDQHEDDTEQQTTTTTQKPFFVVDKKTIEKIDWKPPSDKNWLKGFFKGSSTGEQHSESDHHHSNATTNSEEQVEQEEEYMDELDMEAQKYLLNVRFEAQNFCEKTVVASNIDSKDFESNRSSMKEMDQSLYSTIHLFDAFESGTITVSSNWEDSFMRSFKSQRNTVQTEIDKRLRGYTTSGSGNVIKYQHAYPPLNGHYDKWKLACLGEENVYILWEQHINKQHAESPKDLPDVSKEEETSNVTLDESTTTNNMDETSDSTSSLSNTSTGKKKNRRGARKRQKKDTTNDGDARTSTLDTKIPTNSLITDYLDYLTIHALFSKMIHWTVSNFHNNSILRRKPSLVTSLFNNSEDEDDADSEQSTNKEKWIINHLTNESSNSDNISRCNWLYHLFLAIDKPPNDTIGANMNQLLVWILENFPIFTPEEKEEFKKLVIIIIKYFGQGNPSIIKYQEEEKTV